jgi:hypothetical protein
MAAVHRRHSIAAGLVVVLVVAAHGPSFGACPQDACACLGRARQFEVVAIDALTMQIAGISGLFDPRSPFWALGT